MPADVEDALARVEALTTNSLKAGARRKEGGRIEGDGTLRCCHQPDAEVDTIWASDVELYERSTHDALAIASQAQIIMLSWGRYNKRPPRGRCVRCAPHCTDSAGVCASHGLVVQQLLQAA